MRKRLAKTMKNKEGWAISPISEFVSDFESGVSVIGEDTPANENNEYGVLKVSAVSYGKFNPRENKAINGISLARAKTTVKKDRIVMSRANSPELVGASTYIPIDYPTLFLSDKLWQLMPNPKKIFSMYWLSLVLSSQQVRKKLSKLATGTSQSMKNIPKERVLKMNVLVPPFAIQKQISEIIKIWNSAIEKIEGLIFEKEIAYTRQLNNFFPKQKGDNFKISDFCQEISVRNNNESDRVLSVTNHSGFVLPEDQFEKRVASADVSKYKLVRRGQFAYNPSRINVGSIARLDDWDIGVLSPMYTVFKLDEKKIETDYFLHWLQSKHANYHIRQCAQGSVRKTVAFADFQEIEMPIPDLKRQKKIAVYLNLLRREISILKKVAQNYTSEKTFLMNKLLAGEWEPPELEKEATT